MNPKIPHTLKFLPGKIQFTFYGGFTVVFETEKKSVEIQAFHPSWAIIDNEIYLSDGYSYIKGQNQLDNFVKWLPNKSFKYKLVRGYKDKLPPNSYYWLVVHGGTGFYECPDNGIMEGIEAKTNYIYAIPQ